MKYFPPDQRRSMSYLKIINLTWKVAKNFVKWIGCRSQHIKSGKVHDMM